MPVSIENLNPTNESVASIIYDAAKIALITDWFNPSGSKTIKEAARHIHAKTFPKIIDGIEILLSPPNEILRFTGALNEKLKLKNIDRDTVWSIIEDKHLSSK